MAEAEPAHVTKPSPVVADEPSSGGGPDAFERAKRQLVLAALAIAGGIGVAGSLDRTTGGVILLVGWLIGIASLHRLGRAGSRKRGA